MKTKGTVWIVLLMGVVLLFSSLTVLAEQSWVADAKTGVAIGWSSDDLTMTAGSWSGQVVDGKAEGKGNIEITFIGKDGKNLQGTGEVELVAGVLDGKASLQWSSGDVFEGYYKNGLKDGKGIYKYADGRTYEGNWNKDKRDGRGVFMWPTGEVYEGDWRNDKREGKGMNKFANGGVYEGDWIDDKMDGYGVLKISKGESYEGEWKNGLCTGTGTYKWTNGYSYQGQFLNWKRNGSGVLRDANGKIVDEGEWKDDKFVGRTALAAPSATRPQADTVLGIPWGASEADAKNIMLQRPNTAYWFTEKDARKNWQVYMGPFNDDRADIRVFFYQGKMFQVIIAHHLSEDNLLAKFNALKNGMVARYGSTSREGGKYLDSEAFWELGGGIRAGLKIRKSYLNKPETPFMVQLAYWQRDTYLLVNPEEKATAGPGKDF